jgi:CTP:molybdopterin cytidylyltransferase MocA
MGAFKPLLPWGNSTVVTSCINYLRQGGASEIIVVGGNRADDVKAQIAGSDVKFALNDLPNSEMSVSIARGVELASEETDAFLIALCDQPAIPFSVVKDLIEYRGRTGVLVIKPDYQGRGGHPILIGSEFRKKLVALDAGTSLRSFLGGMTNQTTRLRVDSPFVVRDMDTWQDYVSLHREVFGFRPLISRPESESGP